MLQIALSYVKLHISYRENALDFLRLEYRDCVEQIKGMEGLCSKCRTQSATGNLGGMLLCDACMAPYFSSTLPTLSGPSTQSGVRSCRKCNVQVSNSEVICRKCGYTELGLVPDMCVSVATQPQPQSSTPSSASGNPCWTCVCGYEYNLGPTCQKCPRQKPQISASQYPQQLLNQSSPGTSYWTCSSCRYGYNMQTNCQQCGFVKDGQQKPPNYQEAPAVMQSAGMISQTAPNDAYWACGNCQYAYNMEAYCLKCKSTGPAKFQKSNRQAGLGTSSTVRSQQPGVPIYPSQPQQPGVPIYPSQPQQPSDYYQPYAQALVPPLSNPTPGLWTCAACGYAYNPDNMTTCGQSMCGKPKPILESVTQVETWMCPNCSQVNPGVTEACIKCKVKRGWENYLEFKGMELNYNKTMWKCKKCGRFSNISDKQCTYCGKIPKAIKRGLTGEGYKSSFLQIVKKLAS